MTPELEQQLIQKYPDILKNIMHPYYGGIAVGDGWYGIIDKLCEKLAALPEPPVATQIKEKFGGLRFYIGGYQPETYALINIAEKESETTCEECGLPGTISGKGWLRCLCVEHAGK